jgi:competence protein ComEC
MKANQRAPALYALLFFTGGITISLNVAIPAILLLTLTLVGTVAVIISQILHSDRFRIAALCFTVACAGAGVTSLQLYEIPPNHILHFTGGDQAVTVLGTVCAEPDIRLKRTFLTVSADSLIRGSRALAVSGKIRLNIKTPTSRFNYQDRLRFSGFLNSPSPGRNPGAFDYRRYLLIRDVHTLVTVAHSSQIELVRAGDFDPFLRNLIAPLRAYIIRTFERHLPREEAAVMRGFLIGDIRHLSQATIENFRDTGTLHVLAASGANVAYVVGTILILLRLFRLPRAHKYLIALAAIVIFSFLAYNQPSVVRASLMGIIGIVGMLLYRDIIPLNVIAFSALIILAVQPLYLLDIGFQLSYAAAFGLVICMPEVNRRLKNWKRPLLRLLKWPMLILAVTLTAQLWVMPILLHNFHQAPLVSFLSNLIIVPLVGAATAVGIVLIVVSPLVAFADVVGKLLSLLVSFTLASIRFFQDLPVSAISGPSPPTALVVAYYALLLTGIIWISKRRAPLVYLAIFLVAGNVFVWTEAVGGNDPALSILFLDAGSGHSVLVRDREGRATLIDGGGCYSFFDRGELVVAPVLRALGVRRLDRIIATDSSVTNLTAIHSVIAEIEKSGELKTDTTNTDRIEFAGPFVRVGTDDAKVIIFSRPPTERKLDTLPNSIDVIACGWSCLSSGILDSIVQDRGVATVIITSYPSHHGGFQLLKRFRREHPGVALFSTLEHGGVLLQTHGPGWQAIPTIPH